MGSVVTLVVRFPAPLFLYSDSHNFEDEEDSLQSPISGLHTHSAFSAFFVSLARLRFLARSPYHFLITARVHLVFSTLFFTVLSLPAALPF